MTRWQLLACASIAVIGFFPAGVMAQEPSTDATALQLQRELVSTEVLPDRRVTFRLFAPKASAVALNFLGWNATPQPMGKDQQGIWSITVGPVMPDIYNYSFQVDGVRTPDPANLDKAGMGMSATEFELPGSPPRFDEVQNVPHGSVNFHFYTSTTQQRQRPMYVYVPPQYYTNPTRKFPVLYLWHGANSIESSWFQGGRAAIILDNLLAQNKAVPMIVVMPSNNVLIPVQSGSVASSRVLEKELFEDLMPYLEKHYRVLDDRGHRAIAGLSAGGGTTMNVGMRRLDQFAYIGEFSSGIFGGSDGPGGAYQPDKMAPGMYQKLVAPATRPAVFWMSVGTEDPRLPYQRQALETFHQHGIQPLFRTYPGAHEWTVWRHSLAEFVPLLFR